MGTSSLSSGKLLSIVSLPAHFTAQPVFAQTPEASLRVNSVPRYWVRGIASLAIYQPIARKSNSKTLKK